MRGFIGPIGDDLPSLVPLLIALTIFFAAFASTLQVFGEKNAQFNSDLGVLQIVRILRSDNYITSTAEFNDLCSSITSKQFNYVAGITEYYTGLFPEKTFDPFDPDFMVSGETNQMYFCTNLGEGELELSNYNLADTDLLIRTYPIAVEERKVVRVAHLVVLAWD